MRAEQIPAQAVDQDQADPLRGRQLERVGLARNAQRGEDGRRQGIETGFRVPRQGGLDRLRRHERLVFDESAWANASTCSTASCPSAASLIRIVTSSDVIAPV